MFFKTLIALTLPAVMFAQDRILQTTNTATTTTTSTSAFSSTLKCGNCITGDYIFCVQTTNLDQVFTTATMPTTKCCATEASCPETKTTGW